MRARAGKRARRRALAAAAALALCALALGASSAEATPHEPLYSFGPEGTTAEEPANEFGELTNLALDPARRRLYVRDQAPGEGEAGEIRGFDISAGAPPYPLIEGFDPLAVPEPRPPQPGLAVDHSAPGSAGDVYFNVGHVASEREMKGYDPAGAPLAGTPFPVVQGNGGAVAVDSRGRIWAGERTGGDLRVYSPAGALLEKLDAGVGARGLAFDANGDLYVVDASEVRKLDAASGYAQSKTVLRRPGAELQGGAVDRRSHRLFVVSRFGKLWAFDSEGQPAEGIDPEAGVEPIPEAEYSSVAADPTDHRLYLGDKAAGRVEVLSAGELVPSLELEEPDPLSDSAATVHGTVGPEGLGLSDCRFEWLSESRWEESGFEGAQSAACEGELPADEADHPVLATLEGLHPATAYRYRIVAEAPGAANSFAGAFITPGPPAVQTTGASLPAPTEALPGGRVNPEGAPTTYRFQYTSAADYAAEGFVAARSTDPTQLSEDEVQRFKESSPIGTFTLGFAGQSTAPLPVDATGSEVQGALEGLEAIGPGAVEVQGGRSTETSHYTVSFTGSLAGKDVPAITKDGAGNPIETVVQGGAPGRETRLVAARVGGLEPATTYRYRLVAENGDGETAGETMSLTTHAAAPPGNESFPHPPGNDRAYEQVSIPDSGGNPVNAGFAFSGDGEAVLYQVAGGTPISSSGTIFSQLVAKRPPGEHPEEGWRQQNIVPRSIFDPSTAEWRFFPDPGFDRFAGLNASLIIPQPGEVQSLWAITPPAGPYEPLKRTPVGHAGGFFEASEDLSRVITVAEEDLDPSHEADPGRFHLYEVGSGSPHLLDLLPGTAPNGPAAPCGVSSVSPESNGRGIYSFQGTYAGKRRWITADGRYVFFPSEGAEPCGGTVSLYVRDLQTQETKLVSGPAESGPECSAAFIRATPGAAFFWTQAKLDPADRTVASCPDGFQGPASGEGGDVYRYEIATGGLRCVTCVASRAADVEVGGSSPAGALGQIGVSEDGSALYFASPHRLVPGAAPEGTYRAQVSGPEAGRLDYVAPGEQPRGDALGSESAVSADGGVLAFSSADPRLDPQGGMSDGGFPQYYRYAQADRSLQCVSCPPDGSPPRGEVVGPLGEAGTLSALATIGGTPLSADGGVLAFDTPSPLVGADVNTAPPGGNAQHGQDVYEWRGGRALLVSQGSEESAGKLKGEGAPQAAAVSPDGRDVFFFATARLTPDALDGYRRLYDARVGGGIRFPAEAIPCDLSAGSCEGPPSTPPERPGAGSAAFRGPHDPPRRRDCARLARRLRALAHRKRRLRARARALAARAPRAPSPRRARALRRRSAALSRRARGRSRAARRLARKTGRCRAARRAER